MAIFGKGKRLAARLEAASAQRKYVTRLTRKPFRNRTKNSIKKTPAEQKIIAAHRAERRAKVQNALASARHTVTEEAERLQEDLGGHDANYYQHQILQQSRLSHKRRRTSTWNVFLREELRVRNSGEKVASLCDARSSTYVLLALPPGVPKYSSSNKEVVAEISAKWAAMTKEEKDNYTVDLVKDLDEVKEMKSLAVQNVPINVFHDVRANMSNIFEELRRLHARTGLEVAVIAVKTARDQHTTPMTFGTSKRVHDFFQLSLGNSMEDVSASFEAYALSGVSGLIDRSVDVIQGLQSRAAALILQKLGQITSYTAHKMFYVGFDDHITSRFGVVLEGWPIPRFVALSTIRTHVELTTVLNAWENDVSRFRKLTKDEWESWKAQPAPGSGVSLPPDAIRAVTFASFVTAAAHITAGSRTDSAPASNGGINPTVSLSSTSTTAPEPVVPASKPRKCRADHGKSHKKQKGTAAQDADDSTRDVPPVVRNGPAVSATAAASTSTTSTSRAPTPVPATHRTAPHGRSQDASTTATHGTSITATHGASSTATHDVTPIAPLSGISPSSGPGTMPAAATHAALGAPSYNAPTVPSMPDAFPFFPTHTSSFIFAPLPTMTHTPNAGAGGTPHEWHMPPPFAIDPALLADTSGTVSIANMTPVVGADLVSSPTITAPLAHPPAAASAFQFIEYSYNSEGGQHGKCGKRGGVA
ncbi:hypothetical protein TRAPUB_13600 [Trametes pubescens]|uniref:Uncharacterized protein n=1 Tax=Trametes pubescens TaxID=154538 RepID=A0A1M2VQN3_TRAPU|nr:hypothetical protein TRAPUB_13600 [Trametes pubescens]